jgi:hypothetical protein
MITYTLDDDVCLVDAELSGYDEQEDWAIENCNYEL